MVPFRMEPDGVRWLDILAAQHHVTRSDVVRACLRVAAAAEDAGQVSAVIRQSIAAGRITPTRPSDDT